MKCIVKKEVLLSALSRAEKVTGKNHTLPILSCVLLSISKNTLSITATNLEVGVTYTIPVNNSEDGSAAVSGSIIVQLVSTLPNNSEVQLKVDQGVISVESSGTRSKISIQNSDEFPALPKIDNSQEVKLPSKALYSAITTVSFCASNSTIKPELSSIYIHPDGGVLIATATDSFRLAEKRVPLSSSVSSEPILIPIRSVPNLLSMLETAPETITIRINTHQLSIQTHDVYITLRLVSGTFPDYPQIIPKESTTEFTTLSFDIERILRRAAVFTDQFNQTALTIKPKKKNCTIHTQHTAIGETIDNLTITGSGEDLEIKFNQRYLFDAFHSIKSDSVRFQFSGQSQPVVIRPVGDTSYLYLVMPMNR